MPLIPEGLTPEERAALPATVRLSYEVLESLTPEERAAIRLDDVLPFRMIMGLVGDYLYVRPLSDDSEGDAPSDPSR